MNKDQKRIGVLMCLLAFGLSMTLLLCSCGPSQTYQDFQESFVDGTINCSSFIRDGQLYNQKIVNLEYGKQFTEWMAEHENCVHIDAIASVNRGGHGWTTSFLVAYTEVATPEKPPASVPGLEPYTPR